MQGNIGYTVHIEYMHSNIEEVKDLQHIQVIYMPMLTFCSLAIK